jgi:CRISPR/Cas system-associated exonuclease Cas4 (RecB family)
VLGDSVQETSDERSPWEVLTTQAHDGSSAAFLQSVPTQVEAVVDDSPLGADSIEADWVEPRPDDAVGGM